MRAAAALIVIAGCGNHIEPEVGAWRPISAAGDPTARTGHTAIWTGTEMIVWGGGDGTTRRNGGRYRVADDSWLPMSDVGAPAAAVNHTAVWTGTEMIVWGGLA